MNIQTIRSVDGQEFVLLPARCYVGLKQQIDDFLAKDQSADEYMPFIVDDFVKNPVALARIKAGVTQEELATEWNVSQAYISKLESSSKVSAKVMLKVQEALRALTNK